MTGADRRRWWTTFLCLGALGALWAVASPPVSGPDEDAHVVEAAATALLRPSTSVEVVTVDDTDDPPPRVDTTYRLPAGYGALRAQRCFAFFVAITPACAPGLPDPAGPDTDAVTNAGSYPPAYYALVGWPARLLDPGAAVRGMRLASSTLCAAVVASAVVALRRVRAAPVVAGMVLALPPMALYLFASVNPSALEIAAGVGAWAGGLALLEAEGDPTGREVARLAVPLSLLALARPTGPLLAAGTVAVLVAGWGRRDRVAVLARSTTGRIAAVATAVAWTAAAAWLALVDMPLAGYPVTGESLLERISRSLSLLPDRARQLVGVLGWLDTPVPAPFVWGWLLVTAGLVTAALVQGSWRHRVVLGAMVAAVPLTAAVGEALQVPDVGYIWQGRYSLPVFAGVPILAASIVARRPGDPAGAGRVLGSSAASAVALGAAATQVLTFAVAMSRYTAGDLAWLAFLGERSWEPPGGAVTLVVAFVVVVAVLVASALWGLWAPSSADRPPSPAQRATPGVVTGPPSHRPASGMSPEAP